ncbi:hypothetical protein HPT27_05540 [Permianibacter sp. IMCC34836]|uniref:hypothetical protein n=1 Tax=Permianibacter fluminis TaxID=2738515 RepID=UPI0015557FB3|nr:hypothetical protein [Permianibacter fluminis]NQD36482.1 hypothetical protein [Permianibacter fluminis]
MTKIFLLPIGFMVLSAVSADDCTYDTGNQRLKLTEIATQHSGAAVSFDDMTASWNEIDGSKVSVTYGGCDHLGFSIRRSFPKGKMT